MAGDELYKLPGGYWVVLSRVPVGLWREWRGKVYIGKSSTPAYTAKASISKNQVIEDIVRYTGISFSIWERTTGNGRE